MSERASAATCLVVDDSRVVRKAARRILEKHGFQVQEAENGEEALTACRHALPDSILLDWNMPVMDGLQFLVEARREFGPDRPIVVFCTTEGAMDRIVTALEAGAQEYVMKPFDEDILRDKFVQAGLLQDDAA
ncbi:response regulator [Siccirubricoccus sp. KC 17139]|uniref:Response regulator n=1 Tax=Siccirubricoccus soli TaxID=2899147 RepID=A0ABT1CZ07_9PROT|nr:response regulator [Siccirubricoccus soli]MCO6414903.1 response regulator [Siccirubricoccus soli]MCP2681033.1 response regulator [Siccirubricoccus soli]